MGVNDLNLLKSWNPNLLKNKQKIWKERELLKEEDKKIQQLSKELTQTDDINSTKEDKLKYKNKGLTWMYDAESAAKSSKQISNEDSLSLLKERMKGHNSQKKILSLKDSQENILKKNNKVTKSSQKEKINNRSNMKNLGSEYSKDILKNSHGKKQRNTRFSNEDPMSRFNK
ncbi:hypothetical protein QEN19_002892 [Hanseniaspora menglaensis]